MKSVYWVIVAAACLLWLWWSQAPLPQHGAITARALKHWYEWVALLALGMGLFVGLGFLAHATYNIHHRPHLPANSYLDRVVSRGLVAGLVAMILVIIIGCYLALGSGDLGNLLPKTKLLTVCIASKFFSIVALGTLTALIAFSVGARVLNWGGRYSLIPPSRAAAS